MPAKEKPGIQRTEKAAQRELKAASGEPISAYPNWDPARRVLVVHGGECEQDLLDAYGASSQSGDEVGSGRDEVIDLDRLDLLTTEILPTIKAEGEKAGARADGGPPAGNATTKKRRGDSADQPVAANRSLHS